MNIKNHIKFWGKEVALGVISSILATAVLKVLQVSTLYIIIIVSIIIIIFLFYIIYNIINKQLFAQKVLGNAAKSIFEECKNADWINIFVMKGSLFTKQDQVLYEIFDKKYSYKEIKFLMVNPKSLAVERRAKEIFNRPVEHLQQEIIISLETIMQLQSANHNITVKLHNENASIRFVYTEKVMFFSYMLPEKYALNTCFYKVNSTSPLYESYKKYFEEIFYHKSIFPEGKNE